MGARKIRICITAIFLISSLSRLPQAGTAHETDSHRRVPDEEAADQHLELQFANVETGGNGEIGGIVHVAERGERMLDKGIRIEVEKISAGLFQDLTPADETHHKGSDRFGRFSGGMPLPEILAKYGCLVDYSNGGGIGEF